MRHLRKLILVSGAGAILVLAGCKSSQPSPAAQQPIPQRPDDKTITEMVKRDLDRDPACKYPNVDVQTFNGVVQLSGFALASEQKRRAGEIAQSVDGVIQVENNVTIRPPGSNLQPTGRASGSNNINQSGKQASR